MLQLSRHRFANDPHNVGMRQRTVGSRVSTMNPRDTASRRRASRFGPRRVIIERMGWLVRRLGRKPWLSIAPLACALCGCSAAAPKTQWARVQLTDVTVGVTKAGGEPWDGLGPGLAASDLAALAEALDAGDAVQALTEVLARPVFESMDKPDVVGKASLAMGQGQAVTLRLEGQDDTLRPSFDPKPTWHHVPLDGSARIEVTLLDSDLTADDPIGTFVISSRALAEAARRGTVHQVRVAEQTGKTVLFVGVLAVVEN